MDSFKNNPNKEYTSVYPAPPIISLRSCLNNIFKISVITVAFLYFYLYYISNLLRVKPDDFVDTSNAPSYAIRTDGCTIPSMYPFGPTVKKFYKNLVGQTKWLCKPDRSLLKRNRTHIWIAKDVIPKNITDIVCCSRKFYRPDNVINVWAYNIDSRTAYANKCVYFTEVIEIKDDFVNVTCYSKRKIIYQNIFLFAPKKNFIVYDKYPKALENKTSYNVIIMGIDSVSRLNFHRTMPKTLKFLKNKDAVELLGYTKVGPNTYSNLIPFLTGTNAKDELQNKCYPHKHATFDFCPFLWTWYKRAGYYTAFAEDNAHYGIFNNPRGDGFFRSPADYFTRPFSIIAGKTNCIKDKFIFDIILEYIYDLMWTLKPSKLFGFFWSLTLSHDNLNGPTLMDARYLNLLHRMDSSNFLNNTIVFLISDHGMRYGEIRLTQQGRLEESLPFVYALTPPSFREKFPRAFENLKNNAKRLTSPYDMYETLSNLIDPNNLNDDTIVSRSREAYGSHRGISLFLPIPSNRTCKMAGISENWCCCVKSKNVLQKAKERKEATAYLVEELNAIVRSSPQCASLTLDKIIDVSEYVTGNEKYNKMKWRNFLVVVTTNPGGGMFEGLLRLHGSNWTTIGMISRINRYYEQSHCVHTAQLKPYCYCI